MYKLGRWEKAEQFDERGFAKVKKKEGHELIDYLLDTFGNIYRVAYDINNLGAGVVALDLSGKKLRNYLQAESDVWTHKELNLLLLDGNGLNTLPPEIGQLKNLTYLDLSNNELKSLPSEIEQLRNLKTLLLSSNQLAVLPSEIGQLKNLNTLDVRWNQLTALPPEIGHFTSLKTLDCSSNQITALPPEIGQLKNLKTLDLGNNQLPALCTEIGQLTNLTALDLSLNPLYGPPSEIRYLKNLATLNLAGSHLTYIPSEIGQLENLTNLDLRSNELTDLPPALGQLKSLDTLHLSGNQLASLPPEIGQLRNLKELSLSNNDLTASSLALIRAMLPNCRVDFNYMLTAMALFDAKKYQDAYEMQKVAIREEDENSEFAWRYLSEYALYVRKPKEAIAAAQKTLTLNSYLPWVESYRALGYLLDNQWLEAEKIYLKWKEKDFPLGGLWNEIFLMDLEALEAAAITHPDFAKVKAMLQK